MYYRVSSTKSIAVLAVALTLAATTLHGLPGDSEQPIEILADEGRYDPDGTSVLTGAVRLAQGTLRLEAHRVTISTRDKRMHRIVAEGQPGVPVQFRQRLSADEPVANGRANRSNYAVAEQRLELQGDAFLSLGEREFAGDRIFWDIKNGRVNARSDTPGGVRMKWQPEPKTGD